jgi:hypothetical protein
MAASAAMAALVTTALTVPAKTARMVASVVRAAMRVRAQQLASTVTVVPVVAAAMVAQASQA